MRPLQNTGLKTTSSRFPIAGLRSSRRLPRGGGQGFTLIELLIVIAIIAILALIAIPNFLEAQTRSKVARSLADMRSLATGLEAYFVDCNNYPEPDQSNYEPQTYLNILTTPVGYITALPKYEWKPWQVYIYDPVTWALSQIKDVPFYRYECKPYWDKSEEAAKAWGVADPLSWRMFDPMTRHCWYLGAVGPDGVQDKQESIGTNPMGSMTLAYDPSNGTISVGDIIRMGP